MSDSETEGEFSSPMLMAESLTPPTEVRTEVTEKASSVAVRLYNNSRTVNSWLCLSPDEATQLAEQLEQQAEQLQNY